MISIKHFLPRCVVGYSKHTPKSGTYKELYFNTRKPMFNNDEQIKLSFIQKIKLGFTRLKNHFIK